jgi:hypothetical protein
MIRAAAASHHGEIPQAFAQIAILPSQLVRISRVEIHAFVQLLVTSA